MSYSEHRESCLTLHRWLQIVGKIRLANSPWLNHSWQATFYPTAQGLTTSLISIGQHDFSIDFDFLLHTLFIQKTNGQQAGFPLKAESVAAFHGRVFDCLRHLGIETSIHPSPNELPDSLPFVDDVIHRSYEPEFATAFWLAVIRTQRVMQVFRSRFIGKVSPIHLFWGGMDLALTRFSGRRAPEHPGGIAHLPDLVTREAYSHEVSSCGFWPGNDLVPYPAFYAYAYPIPRGFDSAHVGNAGAFYHEQLLEFILPYDSVRTARDPEATLLDFFQRTYEAAANLGAWDRRSLEESAYLKMIHQQRDSASQRKAA